LLRRLVQKLQATTTTTSPKTAYKKSIWSAQQPNPSRAEIPIDLEPRAHESNWRKHNDPLSFLEKVALVGNKLCDVAHQPILSEMKSYARYLESASDHASVVVSIAGLLAIAPGIVRKGDIIAMVAGAHGPVMLRPDRHSGCFAFRGFVLLASYGHDGSLQDFWKRNGIGVEKSGDGLRSQDDLDLLASQICSSDRSPRCARLTYIGQYILITWIQTYLSRIGVSTNYREPPSQKNVVQITPSRP
jgi:hypothetical protein